MNEAEVRQQIEEVKNCYGRDLIEDSLRLIQASTRRSVAGAPH
jgi:hypothetical protein